MNLPCQRTDIPFCKLAGKSLLENFYLADGTALALHLEHRWSEEMINNPGDYKWSSYREYISGKVTVISRKQRDFLMGFFPKNKIYLFKELHKEDFRGYLNTKEEIEHIRIETAHIK